MELSAEAVAPGQTVEVRYPSEATRGIAYTMSRWNGERWEAPAYLLISDGGPGFDCQDCPRWEALGDGGDVLVQDIGIFGPGPERIVIPDAAGQGHFRVCEGLWELTDDGAAQCVNVVVSG